MLSLFEELFLLALDEDRGRTASFAKKTIGYGLSGAILAELALQGKVSVNEKNRLEWTQGDLTGDAFLDEILEEIRASEKAHKLAYWVSQFSERPKKLRERVGERLVEMNVLYREEKRFFRQPPSGEAVEAAEPSKFEVKHRLRAMILSNGESDPRSLALLNLTGASELLGLIFTPDELGFARRRIHEEMLHFALEDTVMQTVEEIEQAISTCVEDEDD
jgi:Golgi phosphoprotein 3